jgi:hypothetical protein
MEETMKRVLVALALSIAAVLGVSRAASAHAYA